MVIKMGLFDFFKSDVEKINNIEFPKFDGRIIGRDSRRKYNYTRKNYYYSIDEAIKVPEYISKINSYGFNKATEVRYQNSNGDYIIIDPNYVGYSKKTKLHIAFHAKK